MIGVGNAVPATKSVPVENGVPANGGGAARPTRKLGAGGRSTASLTLDRMLPNSLEAEIAVLGAVLVDPQQMGSLVRERLNEEHFYHAKHQAIYREIAAMQDTLRTVDLVTLTQRLADKQLLEEVGGAAYLSQLMMSVPTTAHTEHYVDILVDKFLLRRLIATATDIVGRAFEDQDNVREWLAEVEQQVFDISAEKATTGARLVKDLIKDAMASIEKLYDSRGALSGLATGFRDLDRITSGLHPANMIVIAGRPSMGKTSLAMNIAENLAIDQGKPVGIFSLEMSAEELVKRMLCSRAKVNLRAVSDGFLGERDFHPLTAAASQLMKAPLYIDDAAGLTIQQIRARARRMKLQYDICLVVIDYLQLMRAPSRRADQSRQVEISDISSGIKGLAKELQVPVMVLSQLNRQPEQREGGKPKLSDLRESGAIEQDADVVGLLVRPEVYADEEGEKAAERGKATLIIAKQRNGPTGEVALTFLHEYTRFEDAARVEAGDVPEVEGSEE